MKTIKEVKNEIEARKERSAWDKGVNIYALELLEQIEENREFYGLDKHLHPLELKEELLNGADSWEQYSWGGSSLIYDEDIAQRLCTPSELKRTRNGERRPNAREEWLDTQARALRQAASRILQIVKN